MNAGKAEELQKAVIDALHWHVLEGCAYALEENPVNAFAVLPPANTPQKATAIKQEPQGQQPVTRLNTQLAEAVAAAQAAPDLKALEAAVRAFEGFPIKNTATNCVFADGVAESKILIIGEAPGADEDRQGKPFVGVSGQLLDKMLAAIGLDRTSNCYITNVLHWRPPGNRTPSDDEIALAQPFLERHIALVQPKAILLAGGVAARAVLNSTTSISKLRGQVQSITPAYPELWGGVDAHAIPIIPTFHPSYLLRTPLARRKAWQDLLAFRQVLGA